MDNNNMNKNFNKK